ncbi:MAG TPA: hypothetical protein VFY12_09970, partial [Arenimonas sp.]|nr:hypothetical protein [Arenimonas sp.]
MLKVLKRVLLSLLAVVVLYVLVLWSELLPRPTETQREALAQMEQAPGAQHGGNAFVFFWQIAYDIPETERESALAADAASFAQWQPAEFGEGFEAPSHARYPRLIERDDPALTLCEEDGACLDAVTAQAGDSLLAGKEAVLERLGEFAGMTFWRHHFGDASVDALPADIGLRRLRWADLAVRFARGETESALHGVCSDIAAWRRLRTNSDSVIASIVSQRGLTGSLRLYSDMRARLPADTALPAACAELQTPPTLDERMACAVFRGEFKLISDAYNDPPQTRQMRIWRRSDDAGSRWNWRLLVNDSHSRHLVAERYARHCRVTAAPLA